MDEHNPEKIPMKPVQKPVSDDQLFQNPQVEPLSGRDQIMNGMFKRPKQEPSLPFKYQVFLAVIMLVFVIVTILIGLVLFKDGLV